MKYPGKRVLSEPAVTICDVPATLAAWCCMAIIVKRVSDPMSKDEGYRVLVERLWPRGMTKEKAKIALWIKEAGASTDLRKWFSHDPGKWEVFRRKYFEEMERKPQVVQTLREILRKYPHVTFVFSAHDEIHNNAVALKEFLERNGTR
jgi:uncharacterized protein YeaO (DUF488 family)